MVIIFEEDDGIILEVLRLRNWLGHLERAREQALVSRSPDQYKNLVYVSRYDSNEESINSITLFAHFEFFSDPADNGYCMTLILFKPSPEEREQAEQEASRLVRLWVGPNSTPLIGQPPVS